MLSKLGYSLTVVVGFTVLSQIASIIFMRVWGPLADRVGSKPVLSMSASLYLLVILAWPFTTLPDAHRFTPPLIELIHVFAGIAAAGVLLTVGALALKVAPEGRETPFLSVASIATNVGIGVGPIVGGLMADFFAVRGIELALRWTAPAEGFEFPVISLAGYDFLFAIAFVIGLASLNMLVELREEGEIPRGIALAELSAGASSLSRMVSSVPGLGTLSAFSVGYLKQVPGADVALGVTAYQLAASTRAAPTTTSRGVVLAADVGRRVQHAMQEAIEEVQDVGELGLELARHATRGAMEAGDELAGHVSQVARGTVLGSVRVLANSAADDLDALRGAGYGVIQGAARTGQNLGEVVDSALQAARDLSQELGLTEQEAASAMAAGVLRAARAEGAETLAAVREVLPEDLTLPEPVSKPESSLNQEI